MFTYYIIILGGGGVRGQGHDYLDYTGGREYGPELGKVDYVICARSLSVDVSLFHLIF